MRPARVLRVITRLNVGGPALHVGILSARLDGRGFETLLVAGREGRREADIRALGRFTDAVRMREVPTLGRAVAPLRDLLALFHVLAIARAYQPDVVHTHMAKAGLIGRIAGRLVGAPVILHTYHGSVFQGYFGPLASRAYLAAERALARISSRLIAVTTRQRDELIALGVAPAAKILEIRLGLELAPFRAPVDRTEARRSLGFDDADGPIVGIVARLVPIKDVATFVRAIGLLGSRIPGLQAIVVGDGEERAALARLAADLGIADRCAFVGWQADMPAVYAAMDVLALSSLNEGSPVTLIEGMAAGVPIVATAVGGVPDVVRHGETGLLVTPRDPTMLADAMEALLDDPSLRERLTRAAREAALASYGATRLVGDMARLYRDLLGTHRA